MALVQQLSNSDSFVKFVILTKKLLSATQGRCCDKILINSYLTEINELDYKCSITSDSHATQLLAIQLCSVVRPSESQLVRNTSRYLVNLVRCGEKLRDRTFVVCKNWILECLEYADAMSYKHLLLALQSLLRIGPFEIINRDLRNLLGTGGILFKFSLMSSEWTETCYLAISCLEALVVTREYDAANLCAEYLTSIQNVVIDTISSLPYERQNEQWYNKSAGTCLRILREIVADKSITKSVETIGQILGVVQSFMFHGVSGYSPLKVRQLRPAAMDLPEVVHSIPRGRNFRNQKQKSRRPQPKKDSSEPFQSDLSLGNYQSDSDTSDSEATNPSRMECKVRLEALQLLNTVVRNMPNREIFGYWPQLVVNESQADARVLTRCILREPASKVKQIALGTLRELLVGAKLFLMHAEDTDRTSFVTFFGTVSAMIRELHASLSLLLSTEQNIAVLTHALKCSASLARGTPYNRLKPGLATKLTRNCRLYIFHKDPTVRVAALSVFEALAASEPITPEILDIFLKQSKSVTDPDTRLARLNLSTLSVAGTDNEYEFEDTEDQNADTDNYGNTKVSGENREISSLLCTCLKNVSNNAVCVPVRLGSVRLIGALAFNAEEVIFPHLEIVAAALVTGVSESETPVALHACRVVETIAGCIGNSPSKSVDGQTFWNIVFDPVARLAQNSQTTLREVACDCLGNIGCNMLSLLSRERSIMIITILFGAARDDESAVRAAALRALGMLVELSALEDDVGFLLDLADVVCIALEDRNPGVRVKAAWTLANLCDCLVRQEGNDQAEPIPVEDVLLRLHRASVEAASDHDKVKCNAVRAVGSTLYLCPDEQTLKDTWQGLDALVNCATTGNDMKVRWNSCRALGFVLSHDPDRILPLSWKEQVFPVLGDLVCHSPNFKVRTNAAWALSVCQSFGKHILLLWKSIVLGLENAQHVPNLVEYSHRDALNQQLCLTLSHLAVHTMATELSPLWEEIKDHIEDTCVQMEHFRVSYIICHTCDMVRRMLRVLLQTERRLSTPKPTQDRILPEKGGDIIKAEKQMMKLAQSASSPQERQIAKELAKLFKGSDCFDNLDVALTIS